MSNSALTYLHILTPILSSIPISTLFLPLPPTPEPLPGIRPITVRTVTPRRQPISTSLLLLALTALLDTVILVADLLTAKSRYGGHIPPHLRGTGLASAVLYSLGGVAVWGSALGAVWWRQRWTGKALVVVATLGVVVEVPNLVLLVIRETRTHGYNKLFAILSIPPSALRLLLLPIILAAAAYPRITFEPADETSGLLAEGRTEYGTIGAESQDTTKPANSANQAQNGPSSTGGIKPIKLTKRLGGKREDRKKLSFREALPKLKHLIPLLWPSTSRKLQFYIVMTASMIGLRRLLNPLVPIALGLLVRALTDGNSSDGWKYLWLYLGARLLNGGSVLGSVQQFFWFPVEQYTDREMQLLCFNHLLDLSLAYHTKRNTGEVLRIIDRGSAINELFRTMLFKVVPTFLDIIIGFTVFIWLFGAGLTAVVLAFTIPYCAFSFVTTWRRQKLRSAYVDADVKQRGISSDVLNNWESVKYFTSEARESVRFEEAVDDLQKIQYRWSMGFQAIYAFQSMLLTIAFASGAIIISWRILHGTTDAAVFVVYLQYFVQFTDPLDALSSLYREIASDVTDAQKMLDLLGEKTEIKDSADAPDLVVSDGVIEFDNVTFSYDGTNDAIKNISFKIGKGESMALVGETGSGKSTILRLLYRFYDIQSGHIYIDGQDISKVSQVSLRKAIGIVPQDSVLWNDTIGANIAYGKPDASDEEVIEAAKAGMIHEKIMGFDEQYDTVVGERGVRLSGGEKQRVSLARMFLKSPAILVLDEATSALDTETEREIQKSLWKLAKGRTSLSIAHRLSTIINSDKIVVMKKGEILEMGGYKDLVAMNGLFAKMWRHQIYTEAELLEQSDLKKIASVVPNSEGYLKAFAGSGTATPKTVELSGSGGPSSLKSGDDSRTIHPSEAETTQPNEDAADSVQNADGFTVDNEADAAGHKVTPSISYADAVKEYSADKKDEDAAIEPKPSPNVEADRPPAESADREDGTRAEPASYAEAVKGQEEEEEAEQSVGAGVVDLSEHTEADKPAELVSAVVATPEKTATEATTAVNSTRPSIEFSTPDRPAPSPPRASAEELRTSPSSSPSAAGPVPFPSAPANTKYSPAPNLKRMSTSTSILSGISETISSSPSRSDGQSQTAGDVPADGGAKADKRRKRLSSIKGFVRRISDQGASLTRSPSGLRSPNRELPPDEGGLDGDAQAPSDERTRLLSDAGASGSNAGQPQPTQGQTSHPTGGNHKNKKKKKHGK